jgi:DNA-binding MarR family transcriptional regulator
MSSEEQAGELQRLVARFVRDFGLHQPDRTPCGQPIPVSEAYALTELARHGELRQRDLVELVKLQKSTTSRLVDQLARRGWVERTDPPDDGRGVLLRITEDGQRAADQLAGARQQRMAEILRHIPETERIAVLRSLAVLVEAVDAH